MDKIFLPNVTLFGIDSYNPKGILKAAEICQNEITFGEVVIITDDLFTKNGTREQRRNDYSRFMLKEMSNYVNTDYVITIHEDGYIINPKAWDNDFLNYDYIGAKWWYKDGMNVGNGGFSLRSKRLLEAIKVLDDEGFIRRYHPEDHVTCRDLHNVLVSNFGIYFAPNHIADRFSIEAWGGNREYINSLGFHGEHINFANFDGVPPYKPLTGRDIIDRAVRLHRENKNKLNAPKVTYRK